MVRSITTVLAGYRAKQLLLVNHTTKIIHHYHRLVIVGKGFLKLPNLHVLIKQLGPSLSRNLTFRTFGKLLIALSTKAIFDTFSTQWPKGVAFCI